MTTPNVLKVIVDKEQVARILNNPANIDLRRFELDHGTSFGVPVLNYEKVTQELNAVIAHLGCFEQ